ncbi:MAG: hypothetical protein E6J79_06950 [Deltaproteobacteria bacterium]|nr:MAG: hypothetical protein E6J79_06950 [Deltaproteobacteria bacterium]
MRSRWSDEEAAAVVARYGARWGEELALRTYTSRLLGAEDRLVLHGGGNTSVKGIFTNRLGEAIAALYVKASGHDLATLEPEGLPGLDLGYLRKLRALEALDDEAMAGELRTHLFDARSATPSLETLVHAFLPEKFVDHTHADAILALSNQIGGERLVREALGDDVAVLGYVRPGFQLARAVADAYEANAGCRGMVWMRHGLMTWGPTARASYETMIDARAAYACPRRRRCPSGRPSHACDRWRPCCAAAWPSRAATRTGRTAGRSCCRSSPRRCWRSSTATGAASGR